MGMLLDFMSEKETEKVVSTEEVVIPAFEDDDAADDEGNSDPEDLDEDIPATQPSDNIIPISGRKTQETHDDEIL